MKLTEVVHEEVFCGSKKCDKYSRHSTRFVLFDKYGRRLNNWAFDEKEDFTKNITVLDVKESGYNDLHYYVGFPTTHIKLDFFSYDKNYYDTWSDLRFGEVENA